MRWSQIKSKVASLWKSPSLAAFLLINTLLLCIILPILCAHIAHFLIGSSKRYQFKGCNVVVVLTFVVVDLSLYAMLKYIVCCSHIFNNCSTKLTIPLCTGSQFIPLFLVFKNIDVLSTRFLGFEYGESAGCVFVVVTISLLAVASFLSVFYDEYSFIRSIESANIDILPFDDPVHIPHCQHVSRQRRAPALLFLVVKLTLFTVFAIELCVLDASGDAVFSSDLPIVISAANVLFVFFSHTNTITKYNIHSIQRSVVVGSYRCLDGCECMSEFHPHKVSAVLGYECHCAKSTSLRGVREVNLTHEHQLPEWVRETLRLRVFTVLPC